MSYVLKDGIKKCFTANASYMHPSNPTFPIFYKTKNTEIKKMSFASSEGRTSKMFREKHFRLLMEMETLTDSSLSNVKKELHEGRLL